jgi:hypothetical protein
VAKNTLSRGISLIAVAAALVLVPTALAGKGAVKASETTDFRLVVLDSTDSLPHWGNHVTFDFPTTVGDQPSVTLNCYQDGVWVLTGTRGFYAGSYGQTFALNSMGWTGGAAECTAELFVTSSNGKATTLAMTSFHAYA